MLRNARDVAGSKIVLHTCDEAQSAEWG